MVTLQLMTETDYQVYFSSAIEGYAQDKVRAGNWSQPVAMERSRKEFEGYLPLLTKRNTLPSSARTGT